MGKMEKFVFVSDHENQDVQEVVRIDRCLIDVENVLVNAFSAFSKRGKDISTIDYEEKGKLNISEYYYPMGMISIAYSRTLFTFEKETIDALLNKISGGETINWKTEHINVTYARWMHSVKSNLYHICKDLDTKEVKILDFCRRVVIVKDEERNMKYGFVFLTLPLGYDKTLAAVASNTVYYMLPQEAVDLVCEENEAHNKVIDNYLNVPEVSDEENIDNPGYKLYNQMFIDFEIVKWQTYVKDTFYNGESKKHVN